MNTLNTEIEGVFLIELEIYEDQRGCFLETYQYERYYQKNIKDEFVQDNYSRSFKNVLRGLHFQTQKPQSQLLTILSGSIFDVLVDLRRNSKTFKKWISFNLKEDSSIRQIYMPPGIAHGFCVLSEISNLHYKVSQKYDSKNEAGIIWNDSTLNINWPTNDPILSKKDSLFPSLADLTGNNLPNHL